MFSRYLKALGVFTSLLILTSCASKEVKTQVSLSANRTMAYVVRGDGIAFFQGLAEQGIKDAYGAKTIRLNFAPDSLLEDPENLFQVGSNLVDDLLIFGIEDKADVTNSTATIYNGANLKIVTILKFSVPKEGKEPFAERYLQTFKRVALQNYPNPNIYPKADPLHFANLLYVYSQEREKNSSETVNCENAPKLLEYYGKARILFDMSKDDLSARSTVGGQGKTHQLSTRLQESIDKTAVLEKCKEDSALSFSLSWEFDKIDTTNHETIKRAAANAGLETILKQYTTKPVMARFKLDENGDLNFLMSIRFEPSRYLAWTKNRVPARIRNYNIVSLDPYYALLQKLVVFRSSLPAEASPTLRASFQNMKMTLALNTILNGQVLLGADGKYDAKTKSIAMAYPNSVILQATGFDSKTIEGRDKEIFQEKSWIALSNCRTLDGTTTEDGLLMKFFGLPCN